MYFSQPNHKLLQSRTIRRNNGEVLSLMSHCTTQCEYTARGSMRCIAADVVVCISLYPTTIGADAIRCDCCLTDPHHRILIYGIPTALLLTVELRTMMADPVAPTP